MKTDQLARQNPGWLLWGSWSIASVIGIPLGVLAGEFVNRVLGLAPFLPPDTFFSIVVTYSIPRLFVIGLAVGFCTGIMEWAILRRLGPEAGWWILASIVGWGIGFAVKEWIELLFAPPTGFGIHGIIAGILVGIAQWLVLRRYVHRAGLWVVALITWDFVFPGLSSLFFIWEPILYGLVHGVITGGLLVYLVRYSAKESFSSTGELSSA